MGLAPVFLLSMCLGIAAKKKKKSERMVVAVLSHGLIEHRICLAFLKGNYPVLQLTIYNWLRINS